MLHRALGYTAPYFPGSKGIINREVERVSTTIQLPTPMALSATTADRSVGTHLKPSAYLCARTAYLTLQTLLRSQNQRSIGVSTTALRRRQFLPFQPWK